MKDDKFNIGIYVTGAVLAWISGAAFSKAMYHKGKIDGMNQMAEEFHNMVQKMKEEFSYKEDEES